MPRPISSLLGHGCRMARLGVAVSLALGCAGASDDEASNQVVAEEESAIKGGTNAAAHAWPWQVDLHTNPQFCSGSLISQDWVLTAGHCVEGKVITDLTVVLGEHDLNNSDGAEQTRTVAYFQKHPTYQRVNQAAHWDAAILRLSSPAILNNNVRPIRLALTGDGPNQNALVSGWGVTTMADRPALLQQATLPILANTACSPNDYRDLFADELCAGTANGMPNICGGDSGGPLSVERFPGYRELVGISSWKTQPDCFDVGVFARVSSVVSWLRFYVLDEAIVPALNLPLL